MSSQSPGKYLTEWLKENNISLEQASDSFTIDTTTMTKLLNDKISFRGYSKRAQQLTSIPREHWLKLQEDYENDNYI